MIADGLHGRSEISWVVPTVIRRLNFPFALLRSSSLTGADDGLNEEVSSQAPGNGNI